PLLLVVRPPEPTVIVAELAESAKVMEFGLPPVFETTTAVLVSVILTVPVVPKETVPAEVVRLPMRPEPEVRLRVPEVVSTPPAEILALPVAVRVIVPEPALIALLSEI